MSWLDVAVFVSVFIGCAIAGSFLGRLSHYAVHPRIWPETVIVRFAGFGPSSLDIEVMAWFELTDWTEFLGVREELYLTFMDIVDAEGSSFAFPTQTVHVVGDAAIGTAEERPSARAARSSATG